MLFLVRKIKRHLACQLIRSLINRSVAKEILLLDSRKWPPESVENLFIRTPEFRAVFFYRIQTSGIAVQLLKFFYPPQETLYICTSDIGPGLRIQHGFATIIAAKRIGKNCWINQQVTIGFTNETDHPTIGDDVTINAGAIVIGNIHIGDRVRIGAGAVVVKSVPADCTVAGNPAYIIRRLGLRVNEKL